MFPVLWENFMMHNNLELKKDPVMILSARRTAFRIKIMYVGIA